MSKKIGLVIMNLSFIVFGLYLAIVCYIFLFGFWGRGPYITETVYALMIIFFYPIVVVLTNMVIRRGVAFVLEGFKKWKILLPTLLILKGNKGYYRIVASIIILIAFGSFVEWFYYYHIPKYSYEERSQISIEEWEVMSSRQKLRVGQSLYIRYKGGVGLYSARSYVRLINEEINNGNWAYCSIENIVFSRLVGV